MWEWAPRRYIRFPFTADPWCRVESNMERISFGLARNSSDTWISGGKREVMTCDNIGEKKHGLETWRHSDHFVWVPTRNMSFACMEMHGSLHTVYVDVVIKHLLLSILGEVLQVLAWWHWDLQRHQGDADRDRAAVGVRHQDLRCREGTSFNLDQPKRDLETTLTQCFLASTSCTARSLSWEQLSARPKPVATEWFGWRTDGHLESSYQVLQEIHTEMFVCWWDFIKKRLSPIMWPLLKTTHQGHSALPELNGKLRHYFKAFTWRISIVFSP